MATLVSWAAAGRANARQVAVAAASLKAVAHAMLRSVGGNPGNLGVAVPLLSIVCIRALAYNRPSAPDAASWSAANQPFACPVCPLVAHPGSDAKFTPPARHASTDCAR